MNENLTLKQTLGMRLLKIRRSLSYTQGKMAALLGISRSSMAKKETGLTFPGYHVMRKLGANFNVSLDWLFFGRGQIFLDKEESPKEQKDSNSETTPEASPAPAPAAAAAPGETASPTGKPLHGGAGQNFSLRPEHRELLEHMEKIPLLHYEIMAAFQRFKIDNEELVEETMQ